MGLERPHRGGLTFFKVIVGDFYPKIGLRTMAEELYIETHGMEWNKQGGRLSGFRRATLSTGARNSRSHLIHETWESPGGQFHNEIDHIIINRKVCLTNVAVVPKFYTGSDHRLFRARFRFPVRGERGAKFRKRSPEIVSIGITSLHWRVCGKIPSAMTSMKNTTGSSNNFTVAPGELKSQRGQETSHSQDSRADAPA
uniref:Endonuclease-reverse transcriptase n=1 Tax=Haemonchus contortus TaxID=6289 RepID=W6NSF2_HAECO